MCKPFTNAPVSDCGGCNLRFSHPLYYRMHCTVFHDPNFSLTIRKYHCKVCGTAVLGKENIMKHAAEMHNGKGAYQCQYCKKVSLVSVHCTGKYYYVVAEFLLFVITQIYVAIPGLDLSLTIHITIVNFELMCCQMLTKQYLSKIWIQNFMSIM